MITVFSNNKEIPTNRIDFSDGAFTYRLNELPKEPRYISINVDPRTPVKDVREEISMILSCIENFYLENFTQSLLNITSLTLNMFYMPYGRADRVFEKGNPSSLEDFNNWLLSLPFTEINICDPHNPEAMVGGNIFKYKSQLQCYIESLPHDFNEKYDYIIAPDKGAMNKAATIANYYGRETGCIYAGKKRDISTGKIIETTIPEEFDLNGAKVLIPDDICDYGGTFIQLAKLLKNRGVQEVHLYVTHAICTGGLANFKGIIDKIFYHHIVGDYVNNEDIMRFNNGS